MATIADVIQNRIVIKTTAAAVGPKGDKGDKGDTGSAGTNGTNGTNGATWTSGAGAPSGGNNGDFYLRTSNDDVYLKTAGVWSVIVNLKGSTGAAGADGATWSQGSGAPSGGANGDFYLRTSNYDVYQKIAGVWTVIANVKGATGNTGAAGAVWYEGSGAPSTTHNNGDFYLNVTNGDVYEQTAGAWGSPVGNIQGPAGSGTGDVIGPASATDSHIAAFDGITGKLLKDGGGILPVKATGAEINTGTDDAKFATAKAITDSNVAFLSDIPAVPVKASGTELDTGTDDAKFATAKALKDSHNVPSVAPGASGNVLQSNGTDWASAAPSGAGAMTLLHEGEGTTTNASGEDLDSFAISGLTVKDTLMISFVLTSTTGNTSVGGIKHVTDGVNLYPFNQTNSIVAGNSLNGDLKLRPAQASNVEIHTQGNENVGDKANFQNWAGWIGTRNKTITTPWTSNWSMALRHEGVGGGGTLSYRWSVWKLAGQ